MLQAWIDLPFVRPETVAASLERCLAGIGYRVSSQAESAEAGPGPGWPQSLAWYTYSLPGASQGVVAELNGRWDLTLTRCLSAAFGCFAVTYESGRVLGYRGRALFHAGRTIAAWGEDANVRHPGLTLGLAQSGGDVRRTSEAWMRAIADAPLGGGSPPNAASPHLLHLQPPEMPFDPYALDLTEEPKVARAAVAGVEERRFRDALEALPFGTDRDWRWRGRRTTGTGVPYAVLERRGAFDSTLLSALARRLQCYAAGVQLEGPGEAVPWIWAEPDGQRRTGRAASVEEYVAVWRDLAVCMGATAAEIIWPQESA